MSQKIQVLLIGATGRMGRLIRELIHEDPFFKNKYTLLYEASSSKSPSFLEFNNKKSPDLVIDFSTPSSTLKTAFFCAQKNVPLFVGTTGFTDSENSELHKILKKSIWALIPNTSLGMYALAESLKKLVEILPTSFEAQIIEIHHAAKKDAPSGSARMLQGVIQKSKKIKKEIPIFSLRAGTEPGEHQILIWGDSERLELKHRAENRILFARGALHLALKLLKKKARSTPYVIEDLI